MLGEHERPDLALFLGVVNSSLKGQVDATSLWGRPRLARLDEVGRGLLEGSVVVVLPPPNVDFTAMALRKFSSQIVLIVEYVGASSYFVRVG